MGRWRDEGDSDNWQQLEGRDLMVLIISNIDDDGGGPKNS